VSLKLEIDDRLDGVSAYINEKGPLVVAKTATNIEADAKALVRQHNLIDKGFLINSIQARKITAFTWEVIVGMFYGIYHEFGTVRLAARPYLGPAADRSAPEFSDAISVLVRVSLEQNQISVSYRNAS
jgi:hypothetical protein